MEKITKKDLTIVELVSFKHSIFVGVEPTRNVTRYIYYYPTKKELHGKKITKSSLFGGTDGGIMIGVVGDKNLYIGINNVSDMRLREIMPMVEGAELVKSNECQDYKDDPYGRLVPCGMINVQTWDISKVIS